MNPEKAKDFKLFTWHDVHEKFKTPDDLKEKLQESFGEHVPKSDFDVGFFESRSTAASNRKWIISDNDLDRMYAICLKIIVRLPSGVIRKLILLVLNALQIQMKMVCDQTCKKAGCC